MHGFLISYVLQKIVCDERRTASVWVKPQTISCRKADGIWQNVRPTWTRSSHHWLRINKRGWRRGTGCYAAVTTAVKRAGSDDDPIDVGCRIDELSITKNFSAKKFSTNLN